MEAKNPVPGPRTGPRACLDKAWDDPTPAELACKTGPGFRVGPGTGWRLTGSKRGRYPVVEPPPRSLGYLLAESARIRVSMGRST